MNFGDKGPPGRFSAVRASTWGIHTIWEAYMGAEPAGPTNRALQGA